MQLAPAQPFRLGKSNRCRYDPLGPQVVHVYLPVVEVQRAVVKP